MKNLTKGELVYIPSGVTIRKYDSHLNPKTILKIDVPVHVLMVSEHSRMNEAGIHYEGETWYVKVKDIYPSEPHGAFV